MLWSPWLAGLTAAMVQAQMNVTVSYDTSPRPISGFEMSLSVIPEVKVDNSTLSKSSALQARGEISVAMAVSTVVGAGAAVIQAAGSAINIYDKIAAKIKAKSDANSCTLTYSTESDDGYYEGYAYHAITTGSNCDTTAILTTVQHALQKCATNLHNAGAIRGCCHFTHDDTWSSHLRLTADPTKFPATTVTC